MKSKVFSFFGCAFIGLTILVCGGCQTPSDRDAGNWKSAINVTVNGASNTVAVTLDSAGNTLASSSRDDAHNPTQTTDTKPVTSVAWGSAGGSGIDSLVDKAKALWNGTNAVKTVLGAATNTCTNCSD